MTNKRYTKTISQYNAKKLRATLHKHSEELMRTTFQITTKHNKVNRVEILVAS